MATRGKLIEFDTKLTLPEPDKGYLILVRDGKLYHRSPRAFFPLFETNCVGINPEDILSTDIIYNFPDKDTIYEYLKNNRCLNKFLLSKEEPQDNRRNKILKMLKDNKGLV